MARLLLSKWLPLMWRSGLLRKSGLLGQEGIKACRRGYYLVLCNACFLLLAPIWNFWIFWYGNVYWSFNFSVFVFYLPKFVQSTTSPKSPLLWPNKISNVSTNILCVEIQKPKLLVNIWVYNYTRMYVCVGAFYRSTFSLNNQRRVYPSIALCMIQVILCCSLMNDKAGN